MPIVNSNDNSSPPFLASIRQKLFPNYASSYFDISSLSAIGVKSSTSVKDFEQILKRYRMNPENFRLKKKEKVVLAKTQYDMSGTSGLGISPNASVQEFEDTLRRYRLNPENFRLSASPSELSATE